MLLTLLSAPGLMAQAGSGDYSVGPGDELQIEVFEDAALNGTRRIASDGTIVLPLTGPIEVAGRTAEGVAARLREVLEESYLQRATVDVVVTGHRSRPITVLGAVRKPGTHYMTSRWNLFEAIAAAGGLNESHGDRAQIMRRSSDGQLTDQLAVNLATVLDGSDPLDNVVILAGDVINIPPVEEITIYFLGEVATQGAVTVRARDRVTLLTAVAKAGGLTERAAPKITIKRDLGGGKREEIVANFQRILAGEEADIELLEGDLIVVKESWL